jgi:hypothetical protein
MTMSASLLLALTNSNDAFIQHNGKAPWSDGWKISIQGRTLQDCVFIFERLHGFLMETEASFKLGTQRLIDLGPNHEQSTKLFTIYVPNGIQVTSFCDIVRHLLYGYEGAKDIPEKKSYSKFSEGIFFRNDRDADGVYIPA